MEQRIIDVNGVGYLVFASSRTLGRLSRGAVMTLLTETVVREASVTVFGFADAWEKEWFLTRLTLRGQWSK